MLFIVVYELNEDEENLLIKQIQVREKSLGAKLLLGYLVGSFLLMQLRLLALIGRIIVVFIYTYHHNSY